MPITREHIGTGLTTRVRTNVGSPWGAEEYAALTCIFEAIGQTSTFEAIAASWEAFCQNLLSKAELPPWDKDVRMYSDGNWTDDLPEDWPQRVREILRPGESTGRTQHIVELRYGLDSQEWFASEIRQRIDLVRTAIASHDTAFTALMALRLGMLIATATLKFAWEPAALTGQKIQRAVRQGGRQRAQNHREAIQARYTKWQEAATDIWINKPGLSRVAVARIVGLQFDVKPNTVRKKIRKPKQ
jgi:hypothetical protein